MDVSLRRGSASRSADAVQFQVIPGIDLRGGACVRLLHGDFAQETVFSDDPAATAARWQAQGAGRLHVVDLEGSRDGTARNRDAMLAILRAVSIPVQVTGGIRDRATALAWLDAGAERVVLGTAAVRDPDLVRALVRERPDALVVAVDARGGEVRVQGWTEGSGVSVSQLVREMTDLGVRRFLYTDIARDGALTGPNVEAYRALRSETDAAIIASGGVAALDDILRLADTGVEGVVVGRALYTGAVSLTDAIAAVTGRGP